ncbi:integral membrane sensor signal transduction histidine kinase [Pseudomonas sp. StFLB209]|uniref:sensor histidine kinase n=1 Tax=Pseudomonas sp. StFLB209 TaxID=1028989 RepID=UPI0004F6B43D|nr:ATP-binding protein [Pseudomonas sp. StFLB209]BAP42248.1 integral membrane sensor signal transduction histidine kinase [Pseudomonas sp. StFLB209]
MDGLKGQLRHSLQLRLSVALAVAILLVATLTGIFSYVSAYDEALEFQDNSLRQVAALHTRQGLTFHYSAAMPATPDDDEETRIVIQFLADGANAVHNDDSQLPLPISDSVADGLSTVDVGHEPFRVWVGKDATGARFVVAQEIDSRNRDARNSAWRALLPFAILFPILLVVVADLIRKLFKPVATLAASLDNRGDQDLRPIDDQTLASEIRPFVQAINRLLGRVSRTLEGQKRFVADAAHELRTPLTALSLQAEALEAEPLPAATQAQVQLLRSGIGRSRKLVEQMLALAAAQLTEPLPGNVSVYSACRRVLEDLMPLATRKQLDIGVEGEDASLPIRDVELRVVIKNLVENAINHALPGGQVDVRILSTHQAVEVVVSDDGPGIAPEEWARVFDPFYRGQGHQVPGSGLGLSIVQTLVQRSCGQVEVGFTNAASRSGCSVRLRWPL